MANFSKLTPTQLTQHLNSFPDYGDVMGLDQASRDLKRAGFRIAADETGKTINGFRYAAWLFDEVCKREERIQQPRTYDEIKEAARKRAAEASASGRDIGRIPDIKNPARREKCRKNLRLFLETYFPQTFKIEWSKDHIDLIKEIQRDVMEGGNQAESAPRGTGKTSILERAGIWAVFFGWRFFMVIVGASDDAAADILEEIKSEIEFNNLLAEDFPEICYPIRALGGISNRSAGQLCCGERTRITWSEEIVLPTIKGSITSGAIIKTVGITGRIRGMKHLKADGTNIRPDFVLIDDPQTRESAESPEQCKKRLRTINGDILGLAGPQVKISCFMTCTVIRPGDVADQILDREKNPIWKGRRRKLLVSFPTNMELWIQYREIWAESLRTNEDISDATEFYRAHQEEMDKGAEVSWPQRYMPGEISGIQYAMNQYFQNKETFYSEFQNEPVPDDDSDSDKITVQQVWDKMNNRPRGEIPTGADHVTMFIDVQKNLLYWMVCAWADNFTGWIVDYGAFPDQKHRNFTLKNANPTYSSLYPNTGFEGSIYAALRDLTGDLLSRAWRREDGAELHVERALIDSGWGRSTDVIFQFCRESQFAAILFPSKGQGITAAQRPFTEYRRNQGDRIGFNWMIPNVRKKRSIRYILYDTNFWKSFYRERLFTAKGDPGSLTVYGSDEEHHRNLAEQLSSEISEPTSGRGRRVDIWKLLPGRDNHWLDCIVGNQVAASERGCVLQTGDIGHVLLAGAKRAKEQQEGPRRFTPGEGGRHFTAGRRFSAN